MTLQTQTITTKRITTRVLLRGDDGIPVLFIHGNLSNATWGAELLKTLPEGYRGIGYDQRGYGAADPEKKVDATKGLSDLADDAIALLDYFNIEKAHIVGHSMGGSVLWWLMRKYPQRIISATQVAPGSPYGFGGCKGLDGQPVYEDFAGSGGGLINPRLIERIQMHDTTTDDQFSPRNALRNLIVKQGFIPEQEDELVEAMLSIHLGEQDYPGDMTQSPNWPYVAPGVWGVNNALSPKYAGDVTELLRIDPKPPVLWVRGTDDLTVSDSAMADPGTLGKLGLLPNYPGEDVYPPQPMVSQTRAILEKYAAAGGIYEEYIMANCGHSPYIENLEQFNLKFHTFINAYDN
ncbi:MAG: alpha/beta hydrolase [Phototrophicales bacterium]|nr:MAG: alpha/beta hydrolase [Phototrophicales bacterium]RMG69502.1 MAG: alpha/beta hydrolase [Chloroflexota bacterium]